MPFTLLKGTFRPAAGIPDGDSVRFAPDDPSPLFSLCRRGRSPRVNQENSTIQLRFEGIDTLEKEAREPFASDATKSNLELLGLASTSDEAPGYILTNLIGPHGRPICFVFAGTTDEPDGSRVFLEADRMKESVNFKQIQSGVSYPLFYDTLFTDLRNVLAEEVRAVRESGIGLWSHDRTSEGVTWNGAASLKDMAPIFPKLWRRLEKYTQHRDFRHESDSLDSFIEFLEVKPDRMVIISESRPTDLDNIVIVEGEKVSLPIQSEDMFFFS